jgi:predicted transposase/invertase (TIGR01784 family)
VKTDSIFYRIFKTASVLFFELVGQSDTEGYQFESIEVKETALRIDGVFLPPSNSPDRPVFFVEVQFQKDEELYHRLFAELFLFLKHNPKTVAWQAAVFFAKRSIEPNTAPFEPLLASPQVHRFYLDELADSTENFGIISLLQLIVKSENQVPELARELWTQVQGAESSDLPQAAMLGLIETILVYKFPHKSRQEIGKMLQLAESAAHTRVYQEGAENEKQVMALRMLDEGMELDLIARITQLTIDQIKALHSQMED